MPAVLLSFKKEVFAGRNNSLSKDIFLTPWFKEIKTVASFRSKWRREIQEVSLKANNSYFSSLYIICSSSKANHPWEHYPT